MKHNGARERGSAHPASPHLSLDLAAISALPHSASALSLASASLNYTPLCLGSVSRSTSSMELSSAIAVSEHCLRSHNLKFPMLRLSLKSDRLLGYKSGVPSDLPCCRDSRGPSLFSPCAPDRWLGPTTGSLQKPLSLLSKKKDYPRAC